MELRSGCVLIVGSQEEIDYSRLREDVCRLIAHMDHVALACEDDASPDLANIAESLPRVSVYHKVSVTKILAGLLGRDFDAFSLRPIVGDYDLPEWRDIPRSAALRIWPPRLTLPYSTSQKYDGKSLGWIVSRELLEKLIQSGVEVPYRLFELMTLLSSERLEVDWLSENSVSKEEHPQSAPFALNRHSRILAVVPHYRCEEWLHQSLHSLTAQTRMPDAIVVIDDGSETSPEPIVRQFPNVTLLRSRTNVGPYNLVQTVINATDYEAYLFQDADDWSTQDRLFLLLDAASRTGAELIGCQELRLDTQSREIDPVRYPIDVNRALQEWTGHPLLHPSSLVARSLIQRIGGFATGLRFGGDTEFLLRAVHAGRVINIPQFCYVRRVRPGSLTTDPSTGFGSTLRNELRDELKHRAQANRERVTQGEAPSLAPLRMQEFTVLDYLCGPPLACWHLSRNSFCLEKEKAAETGGISCLA